MAETALVSNEFMKNLGMITVLFLAATSALANDLAGSFQEAAALADAQEKAEATRDYFGKILLPYYARKYAPVLQSCFATVAHPDNSSFSFVAALGADGRVVRLYDNRETNISRCLRDVVKNDSFPAPPLSPYYLHIDMKFSDTPAAQSSSADGAPPLIVGPDKYSYTFGVPEGWEFSFEQARQRGAALAFFPKGGSFGSSSSAIYVNEIGDPCSSDCLSPLSQSISNTIREVKAESPSVEVANADPVKIKAGGQAAVRLLKGARDPRNPQANQDTEALAFIAHDETIILVVLTARDTKTWDQDYAAFQQVVAGHRFFTCNSPDLAVPCSR